MSQVNRPQQSQPQNRTEQEQGQDRRPAESGAANSFSNAMKKEGPEGKGKKEGQAGLAGQPDGLKSGDNPDASVFSLLARREGREGREGGREGRGPGEDVGANQKPGEGVGAGREPGENAAAGRKQGENAAAAVGRRPDENLAAGQKQSEGADRMRAQGPGGEGAEHGFLRGDAILSGMLGGVKDAQVQAPAAAQGPEGAPRIDGDLTSKLVDRILVSAADSKGGAEVRIALRQDILPGTEIRIQRQPDGGVSVQFVTNDVRAEQMLGQSRLSELQNVLAQNLQVEVRVATIRTDGSMTSDSGSSGQQGQQGQQGQSGGQGQPGDGRSRQRDLFEGLENDQA